MMYDFYVNMNAQSSGEHEVHKEGCPTPPHRSNRISLGRHFTCQEALKKAKEIYRNVDGCRNCIPACHTR